MEEEEVISWIMTRDQERIIGGRKGMIVCRAWMRAYLATALYL